MVDRDWTWGPTTRILDEIDASPRLDGRAKDFASRFVLAMEARFPERLGYNLYEVQKNIDYVYASLQVYLPGYRCFHLVDLFPACYSYGWNPDEWYNYDSDVDAAVDLLIERDETTASRRLRGETA